MRVLIVKTSSMGDVIHTLPAVTDAMRAIPTITFDWMVEASFADIPRLHPAVKKVIPVKFRQWRKKWLRTLWNGEWRRFKKALRIDSYDIILDAQGLLKSAWLARLARGCRVGLDRHSAWEPIASFFYHKKIHVNSEQHAITRVRTLFARALNYALPDMTSVSYGIDRTYFIPEKTIAYAVFLHGTTWVTKHYPEVYWRELCELLQTTKLQVQLPWSNEIEHARATALAALYPHVRVLPRLSIYELAFVLAGASVVIAVDTGLGHLTAALSVPCVSLYGPTDPVAIGTVGERQVHLRANIVCDKRCSSRVCVKTAAVSPACFASLLPSSVQAAVLALLSTDTTFRA